MPETKATTGSAPTPFETYRKSLRKAKEETDKVRETVDVLNAKAREAKNTLDRLEEAIPRWRQMVVFERQDISHNAVQAWQKEASQIINSVQNDLVSGKSSRINRGHKKIKRLQSRFEKSKRELLKDIRDLDNSIRDIKESISKKEKRVNNINKTKKKIGDEIRLIAVHLAKSILKGAGITVLIFMPITIIIKLLEASKVNTAQIVNPFNVTFVLTLVYMSYRFYKKDPPKLDFLKRKLYTKKTQKEKIKKRIKNMKKKVRKLSSQRHVLEEDLEKISRNRKSEYKFYIGNIKD